MAYSFVHQTQRFLHDPDKGVFGDCYRTSLAMMLGMDRDEVPHFCDGPDDAQGSWRLLRDDWLSARNLYAVEIPFDCDVSVLLEQAAYSFGQAVVGISGKSPRGTNHECVIFGGQLFDPHPTRAGFVGPDSSGFHWITLLTSRGVHGL